MITSLLHQDYDDFDVANEDDELEEFLGIPRKTPKVIVLLLQLILAIKVLQKSEFC